MKIRHLARRPEFSRRRFLRGAGGATLALPALSLFQDQAFAQGTGVPKRLVIMFTPNGTLSEEWVSGGGESNFVLGSILEPLADIRDRLLILRKLDSDVAYTGPGDGHQTGMGCMLTGRRLLAGTQAGGNNTSAPAGLASGISIDQYIAQKITGNTNAFDSLPLGIRTPDKLNSWSRMSFSGPGQAVTPYRKPLDVYNRIVELAGGNAARMAQSASGKRLEAKRRSTYSQVQSDLRRLQEYLAADDRVKLEQHLDHVARLEADLDRVPRTCNLPESLRLQARNVRTDVPLISDAQRALAVHALACDLTRVVTLQFSGSVGTLKYTWLGLNRNHHELSHEVDSREDSHRSIAKIDRWHAEQFGKLIRDLESREAEDGKSLLDHTVVLWVNELARGSIHSRRDLSWLMAGNIDGYFKMGRSVDLKGRSNNDLFVTLLHGFGIDDETFGDPEFNEGPLSELLA